MTRDTIKLEHEKKNMTVEAAHEITRSQVVDSAQQQEDMTKFVVEASRAQIIARVENESILSQLELESTFHADITISSSLQRSTKN